MAPAATGVTLRGAFTLAFAFGYLIGLTRGVSWPTVPVKAPPVAVLVVLAGLVSIWVLLLAVAFNLADLLVYVT